MNFAIFGVILVISQTDCLVAEKRINVVQEGREYGALLGKLKSSGRSKLDEEAVSLTSSEILADVFVKGVNTFLPNQPSEGNNSLHRAPADDTNKEHIESRLRSRILEAYKVSKYDKLFQRTLTENNIVTSIIQPVSYKFKIGSSEIQSVPQDQEEDVGVITINPDVKIVGTEYHGKLFKHCKGINVEKKDEITIENDCPVGLKRDISGKCDDPKPSKFISVRSKCPVGSEADWFGFCREKFRGER